MTIKAARVVSSYVPSTSKRRMQSARTRHGVTEPSTLESMKEFLVSPAVQEVADHAAADIASIAALIAHTEITSESSSGAYEDSIDSQPIEPVVIKGNARAAAAVTAHGGTESYGGFTDPESSHAAVVEWGNEAAPHSGRHILRRAGATHDTAKGVA